MSLLALADPPQSPLLEPKEYRNIAGHWLTGVSVVTARDASGAPAGATMNAISPLSLSPPMFLICLDSGSDTLAAIEQSGSFCINLLGSDCSSICAAFAKKGAGKFEQAAFRDGVLGAPVLTDAIAYVECRLDTIHVAGDHKILVGLAVDGHVRGGEPLAYFKGALKHLAP